MLHAPDSPSFLEFYFELLLDLLLCRRAHVAIYPSAGYPWCACEAVKELQGGMARAQRQDVKNDGWAHSRPETGCEDKGCGQLLSRQKGSGRLWMGHLRAPPPKKRCKGQWLIVVTHWATLKQLQDFLSMGACVECCYPSFPQEYLQLEVCWSNYTHFYIFYVYLWQT